MTEKTNSFDIEHSSVQIAPNASTQYTIQNFFGAEYTQQVLNARRCNQDATAEGAVTNMYYYSATKPCPIVNEVFRKAELAMCEKRLADDNVLCLYSEEHGVGVTTLLAQFAREHGENCVSYFYNGLDIMLLNPEIMERSIVEQLYWYVKGKDPSFNIQEVATAPITAIWQSVNRKIKNSSEPLYFVFDGFDDIPLEKMESVKRVLEKMFWGNGRFIFSGTKEKIKKLIPSSVKLTIHEHEILALSDAE